MHMMTPQEQFGDRCLHGPGPDVRTAGLLLWMRGWRHRCVYTNKSRDQAWDCVLDKLHALHDSFLSTSIQLHPKVSVWCAVCSHLCSRYTNVCVL